MQGAVSEAVTRTGGGDRGGEYGHAHGADRRRIVNLDGVESGSPEDGEKNHTGYAVSGGDAHHNINRLAGSRATERRGNMNTFRIALANLRFPATPDESVSLATEAIAQASREGAGLICFPECFVPGYRGLGHAVPPPDAAFLERAWKAVAAAAARAHVAVVLGAERVVAEGGLRITALAIDRDGTMAGFQDKVQLDPSEEGIYTPGSGRRVFQTGPLVFGIAICHEGWRYPETVRWAVRQGAHIVFHPQFHQAEPGGYRPTSYADPANSFHEKAALCRAAENTCYFATVNFASAGSPTTSAVARPDGALLCYQPYGKEGLLIADIDLAVATGLLAARYKTIGE
jgi:predicted amidohydrolase